MQWDLDAERSRRLKVDDELKFSRLQYRHVCWLLALENPARIDADLTIHIRLVCSVAHQPAGCDIITVCICRRNPVARRQGSKLHDAAGKETVRNDKQGIRAPAGNG